MDRPSYATFWMYMPLWVRAVILLGVIFYILQRYRPYIIPNLLRVFFLLLRKLFEYVFTVVYVPLGKYAAWQYSRGNKKLGMVDRMERGMDKAVNGWARLEALSAKWKTHPQAAKRYVMTVALAMLGYVILLGQMPSSGWSKPWLTSERYVLEKLVGATYHDHEEAAMLMKAWREASKDAESSEEEEAAAASPLSFKIKHSYPDGVFLRAQPVEDLAVKNTIATVGPGKEVLYLHEEQKLGNRVWYKVKVVDGGKEGWLSSAVVEEIPS